MYGENDGDTQVFYMKNATTTFCAFGEEPELVEFRIDSFIDKNGGII